MKKMNYSFRHIWMQVLFVVLLKEKRICWKRDCLPISLHGNESMLRDLQWPWPLPLPYLLCVYCLVGTGIMNACKIYIQPTQSLEEGKSEE